MPITPQCEPAGTLSAMSARLRAVGGMPPVTPMTHETWSGGARRSMSSSGASEPTWPTSKHSCSGLIPSSFIAPRSSTISSKGFANTAWNTKSLRLREYFA